MAKYAFKIWPIKHAKDLIDKNGFLNVNFRQQTYLIYLLKMKAYKTKFSAPKFYKF